MRWLGAEVGDIVAVGADIVRIDIDGAAAAADARRTWQPDTAPSTERSHRAPAAADRHASGRRRRSAVPSTGRPTAAPAVRARAARSAIELAGVAGTGPDGRIVHDDLDDLARRAGSGGGTRRDR